MEKNYSLKKLHFEKRIPWNSFLAGKFFMETIVRGKKMQSKLESSENISMAKLTFMENLY